MFIYQKFKYLFIKLSKFVNGPIKFMIHFNMTSLYLRHLGPLFFYHLIKISSRTLLKNYDKKCCYQ